MSDFVNYVIQKLEKWVPHEFMNENISEHLNNFCSSLKNNF